MIKILIANDVLFIVLSSGNFGFDFLNSSIMIFCIIWSKTIHPVHRQCWILCTLHRVLLSFKRLYCITNDCMKMSSLKYLNEWNIEKSVINRNYVNYIQFHLFIAGFKLFYQVKVLVDKLILKWLFYIFW